MSRVAGLAVAAAAALALAVAGPAAAAPPTWLAPTNVSATGQGAYESEVVFAPQGDATAVWYRFDGTNFVVQAADRPDGGPWRAPATLSADGHDAVYPQVAVDGQGTATAVWVRAGVIQAATRAAGGSWSSPVTLSSTNESANDVHVAVDPAGDAVVVWTAQGATQVIESASRRAGGAWQAPVVLSPVSPNIGSAAAKVAIDRHGDAIAVWYRFGNTSQSIVQVASRPANGTWHAAADLSIGTTTVSNPSIGVDDDGDAVAAWSEFTGNTEVVKAATLPATSGVWQTPTTISAAGAQASSVGVGVDAGGGAVVVWMWSPDGDTSVVQSATHPLGGAWTPPVTISGAATAAAYPALAVNPEGDALTTYTVSVGTTTGIDGVFRAHGASGWTAPAVLSPTGQLTAQPAAALDAAGNGVATWQGQEGPFAIVQAEGLDAAGPRVDGLAIPASATAGAPVAFTAAPRDQWSAAGATTWDFGDGSGGATGTSVTHAFAAAGSYTVTVTARDALGNATTATGTIVVGAAPAAAPPATSAPPAGGGGAHASIPPAPVAPPRLTAVAESHSLWRETRAAHQHQPVGTTFSLTLDRAATVSLTFAQRLTGRRVKGHCVAAQAGNRRDPSCHRALTRGTLTATGKAGKNTISFKGAVSHGHRLPPGTYTVTITATDATRHRSAPRTLTFRIAR